MVFSENSKSALHFSLFLTKSSARGRNSATRGDLFWVKNVSANQLRQRKVTGPLIGCSNGKPVFFDRT